MLTAKVTSKLDSIRALRGIAVLMVLGAHLLVIEGKYSNDQILPNGLISGFAGVDLFFVISGFIMVYVTRNSVTGLHNVWRFLLARITRIYPLYWVISLVVFLLWIKAPHLVFSSISEQPNIIKSFLLLPENRPPLLAVGWTLIHEMYFYLLFAVGLLLPRKFLLWFLIVVSAIILVGYWQGLDKLSAFLSLAFSPLIIEFLGGAIAAFAFIHWKIPNWKLPVIAGLVLFIVALIVSGLNNTQEFWSHANRTMYFAPSASLLLYGLVVMEQSGKSFSKALIWVGDQSYSLYLTHILTLSAAGRIWSMFEVPGLWDNIVILPILVICSLIAGQFTYKLIEQPFLGWSYWLRKKLSI